MKCRDCVKIGFARRRAFRTVISRGTRDPRLSSGGNAGCLRVCRRDLVCGWGRGQQMRLKIACHQAGWHCLKLGSQRDVPLLRFGSSAGFRQSHDVTFRRSRWAGVIAAILSSMPVHCEINSLQMIPLHSALLPERSSGTSLMFRTEKDKCNLPTDSCRAERCHPADVRSSDAVASTFRLCLGR
jgi:hypothetical protein